MKPALSALVGVATTILAGLLLLPIVMVVFDNFFQLYIFSDPPADAWKNDLIIWATLVIWFFIASAMGGFVSTLLSEKKEDFTIMLFIIFSFILTIIITWGGIIENIEKSFFVLILSFIGGACIGCFLGVRYKKKKAAFKDIPPSPFDIP